MTDYNPVASPTPNVVVRNPDVRFWLGACLFALSFLAAVAAMFLGFFPEVADNDVPTRTIAFVNAFVSFAASTFGITVMLPNVPRNVRQ